MKRIKIKRSPIEIVSMVTLILSIIYFSVLCIHSFEYDYINREPMGEMSLTEFENRNVENEATFTILSTDALNMGSYLLFGSFLLSIIAYKRNELKGYKISFWKSALCFHLVFFILLAILLNGMNIAADVYHSRNDY